MNVTPNREADVEMEDLMLRQVSGRFNPNADFVFARQMPLGGRTYKPRDPVDKSLLSNTSLYRLWQRRIVLMVARRGPEPRVVTASKLPDNWRSLRAEPMKDLAELVVGSRPKTKKEAIELIERHNA